MPQTDDAKLILWGRNTSSNVMKVLWLLEELGLEYQRHDVGGDFGGTDTPDYRRYNPTGLVPTLQEGDFHLWESNAILRYLANTHPTPLWPQTPRVRATIDQWMDFQQTVMNSKVVAVFRPLIRLPPEQRDPAQIARDAKALAAGWQLLLPQLEAHAFVAGDAFSLADIPLGVLVHRFYALEIERPDLPVLRAWYERLLARPAYARHVARPLV